MEKQRRSESRCKWKTKYYELEGWDRSSGWPTRKTLEQLGLAKVADELHAKGRLGQGTT